ncbi:CopG family transcriptional regulator [Streptomyces sp. cmx-4-25]|uniref:CopG family transcriptional regulator n=1 Tax=unclassified Streptomyces TaxID=2593676 RepID=UPI00398086D4
MTTNPRPRDDRSGAPVRQDTDAPAREREAAVRRTAAEQAAVWHELLERLK